MKFARLRWNFALPTNFSLPTNVAVPARAARGSGGA
jgi:hypothetical protein